MASSQPRPQETWDDGAAYEQYVGRWSRRVAAPFVQQLAVPAGARWLDVGSGSGALSEAVLAAAGPAELLGIDRSAAYVALLRRRLDAPRAHFAVGDARRLPLPAGACDAVVSGLVLNFVPQPAEAVTEMARVVRPGGTVAVYLWDYAGEMQFMRHFWDAAVALDPAAAILDEGSRFPICRPDPLAALLRAAGLADVVVWLIDVATPFRDFDDYWRPFLSGQGPAPGYVAALVAPRRAALRERLRATLPTAPDGSVSLIARAWAARGRPVG